MAVRHADRIWMVGGVIGAALIIAIGWFFAIGPKNTEIDDLRGQKQTTETQLVALRSRLSELQVEKEKLPQYRTALKRAKAALPEDSGIPNFLRQLQDSGDLVDVAVTGVTVNAPQHQTGPSVYSLPITVTVKGNADNLGRFLDELQRVQPRAVLVESATMTSGSVGKVDKHLTMTLAVRAFVAPKTGQPATTLAGRN